MSYKVRPGCPKAPDRWHQHTIRFVDGVAVTAPCDHCGEAETPNVLPAADEQDDHDLMRLGSDFQ